jgi:hypothetical protein
MARVVDAGGYEAQPRDLHVAGVDDDAIEAMQARSAPLGFTTDDWGRCMDELKDALARAGLADADVRIRGSSTQFFSGPHKPFPQSFTELVAQAAGQGVPDEELRDAWRRLGFEGDDNLPHYHYFNSRYALGIDSGPSDYDIQLSSDTLAARLDTYAQDRPYEDVVSPHGGHYRHEYVVKLFPALGEWAERWAVHTGRDVNIASFSGKGPEGIARFSDNDWVIISRPTAKEA